MKKQGKTEVRREESGSKKELLHIFFGASSIPLIGCDDVMFLFLCQ